tara:strand:+ start:365 stop:1006 length:642 start_codon:yes stop_codon:yes gene_type:complete
MNANVKTKNNMKKLIILVMLLCSCGSYQYVNDTMLVTETTNVSMFSNYDANIIRFVIKPITPRFYFANNYGYWGMRPLWYDFDFYQGSYYSYYSSFYRPWNYWDYYLRPWSQGPFNNQGYNVVYNSSRRNSIKNSIVAKSKRSRLILNKKPVVAINKPIIIKPRINYSKPKPRYNPKPNFNNKPSFNSRPSYNSKPSTNNSPSLIVRSLKKGN